MTCERYKHSIEAYVDGECRADEIEALRDHIRFCAVCRRRAEGLSALQELLHRTLLDVHEPSGLWQKISSRLDEVETTESVAPAQPVWVGFRRLAAAAIVVLAVLAGSYHFWPQAQSEQAVVRATIQDFVTFQLSGRQFDNLSADPKIVRTWFDGKIQFDLPPMKSDAAGYKLIGSRLCWLLDRRLGAFTYRNDRHTMTLYVMNGDAVTVSDASPDPLLGVPAARRRMGDYNSLVWRRDDLILSLVSKAPAREMTAFAAEVVGRAGGGHQVRIDLGPTERFGADRSAGGFGVAPDGRQAIAAAPSRFVGS